MKKMGREMYGEKNVSMLSILRTREFYDLQEKRMSMLSILREKHRVFDPFRRQKQEPKLDYLAHARRNEGQSESLTKRPSRVSCTRPETSRRSEFDETTEFGTDQGVDFKTGPLGELGASDAF